MNPWRGVAGLPREVWALAATTFVNRVGTMVIPFLVLYLTGSLGFSTAFAGAVVGIFGATSIVAAPISGRLADRYGATRVMTVSLVLSAAVLAFYPLVRGVAPIVAATVLFAAVSEAYRPASLSAVSLAAGPEQRKAAFALNRLAINLGMSVGPALGGFLAAWSYNALFWVDGASSLAAAAVLAWVPAGALRSDDGRSGPRPRCRSRPTGRGRGAAGLPCSAKRGAIGACSTSSPPPCRRWSSSSSSPPRCRSSWCATSASRPRSTARCSRSTR